jgi:hypothetical protein
MLAPAVLRFPDFAYASISSGAKRWWEHYVLLQLKILHHHVAVMVMVGMLTAQDQIDCAHKTPHLGCV